MPPATAVAPVVSSSRGVTLIGGGTVAADDLALALSLAPVVVAADGGADRALAAGLRVEAVIGDLDSLSTAARAAIAPGRIHRVAEQDSTDFEKCLARIAAPCVIAVGFSGPRTDHLLAVLTTMARLRQPPALLLAGDDVAFMAPPRLYLPLDAGTRVSLWPLGPAQGRSRGLRWPLDGLRFTPAGRGGTSNLATGPVSLALEGPMLVLLPRACAALSVAALMQAGR